MAIICQKYRLLFIMAPRTACTAIGTLLCDKLEGEFIPSSDIIDSDGHFLIQKKHNTVQELIDKSLITEQELMQLFKFTCVRNPFDSLLSMYLKKREKYQPLIADANSWIYKVPGYANDMVFCQNHTLEEWLEFRYSRRSWRQFFLLRKRSLSQKNVAGVDFVMRYEFLQNDFYEVLRKANINRQLTIPRINITEGKKGDYREYYTQKARRIVEYVFGAELEAYGYFF